MSDVTTSHDAVATRRMQKVSLDREIKGDRSAVLIVNTRSRRGARAYSEAKRLLEKGGVHLTASYPVQHGERVPEVVREEIAKGSRFIIVGGGDGTISSVAGHFAYKDVVLGLLPLGTANSFARTIGVPLDLAGAIDILLNGKVADVDLGKINEHYFANGSSIGMPAIVGRATPHMLKKWLGRGAYALVALNKFRTYKTFKCIVTVNGDQNSFDAVDLRIANGAYQGGVLVAPEASPDDGKIVVHILNGPSKWILARQWARLTLGIPFVPAEIEILKAKKMIIDTVPKQHVAIDGEVIAQTPINVSAAREALLLMAPANFPQLEDG